MTPKVQMDKHVAHLGVRFYRVGGVELVLVPLIEEAASFTRMAGDGYFLVTLMGDPRSAYPLDLGLPAAFDEEYLAAKFNLDRRGYGYTPAEIAGALSIIAEDLRNEEMLDR